MSGKVISVNLYIFIFIYIMHIKISLLKIMYEYKHLYANVMLSRSHRCTYIVCIRRVLWKLHIFVFKAIIHFVKCMYFSKTKLNFIR